MSKTIDERVVQMEFDNARFEKNVNQSMSTIDRLKKNLNFDRSAKSFENITDSAKKVNLTGIDKAIETVNVKFSSMQVIAATTLANITNTALYTGKRISDALTVDPIKLGLSEYETQINAVQTILANTSTKGTTIDQVNSALDELNRYADMTIYNFTEMTRNIGTFTAAGVGLQTSVASIKGIANLAAVSGSTSQQASTAMYQLSQALAAGTVKLQDWNSVVNAGMGGEVFRSALEETARVHGIKIDEMIKEEGSFRETLKEGWLTTAVLTETLAKFTGDLNEEQLRSIGYTEEQIAAIIKMGEMANDAATKVKTFTQLADTLKEAAQSGWTQSWQIIIGNFEEARELFTNASNVLSDLINKSAEARNKLLTGGLMSEWGQFSKVWTETMGDGIAGVEGYKEIVQQVATEHGIEIDSMIKDMGSFEKTLKKGWLTTDIMNESMDRMALKMGELSDEELKASGYTREHLEAIQALSSGMKDGSVAVGQFSGKVGELSGREHIISSLQNAFQALMGIVNPIQDAFREFFPPMTSERLYNVTVMLDNFTSKLILSEENVSKLNRTFRGVFAVIDILTSIITGALRTAFTLLGKLTGQTEFNILSLTATIGDSIVAFRDWLTENNVIARGFDNSINTIIGFIRVIKSWIIAFSEIPVVREAVRKFGDTLDQALLNANKNLKQASEHVTAFIDEIRNLDSISFDNIAGALRNLKNNVVNDILDMGSGFGSISNPITMFRKNMTKGFTETGKDMSDLQIKMSSFVDFTNSKFSDFDIGKILTIGLGGSLVMTLNSFSKFLDSFKTVVSSTLGAVSGAVKAYTTSLNANTIFKIATAIAVLAASIAVLTLVNQDKLWSVLAAVLSLGAGLVLLSSMMGQIVTDNKFVGISVVAVSLSASLLLLAIALKQMEFLRIEKAISNVLLLGVMAAGLIALVAKLSLAAPKLATGSGLLIAIALSLNIMVNALKKLNDISGDKLDQSISTLLQSMIGLAAIATAAQKLKLGGGVAIVAAAASLLVLVKAIKVIAEVDTKDITKNMDSFLAVFGMFASLMLVTKLAGKNAKSAGVAIGAISLSLILMSKALDVLTEVPKEGLTRGLAAVSALLLVFGAVIGLSKFAGSNAVKAGTMIAIMGAAILEMAVAIGFLSALDGEGLDRATATILQMQVCFALLVAVSSLVKDSKGVIMSIAAALGVLSVGLGVLSLIEPSALKQATESLTIVMGMFAILVASSSLAKGSIPVLLILAVVIGEIAGILYLMDKLNVGASTDVAESISVLLLALTGSLVLLSAVGAAWLPALIGIGVLTAFIVSMGLVLAGLGALVEWIPNVETWLTKGIPVLEKIGQGFGSFIGNIISGLGSGATDGLTEIGENLTEFMVSLLPFFELVKTIDSATISSTLMLAEAFGIITGIDIVNKIAGWIPGKKSMDSFGAGLVSFGKAMIGYADAVKMLNPESIGPSVTAAHQLAELLKVIPNTGGIAAGLMGDNTFANFKIGLVTFGEAIVAYSKEVSNLNTVSIGPSVTAAGQLTELLKSMPNSGGMAAFFAGDNTFTSFRKGLVGFGEAMVEYSNIIGKLKVSYIQPSVDAARMLVDLVNTMSNSGGIAGLIAGDNTFYHFDLGLSAFGKAMVKYSEYAADIQLSAIANSAKAAKQISELSDFNFDGLLKMTEALKAVANTPINDQATETAGNLIEAFIKGLDGHKDTILSKFDDIAEQLKTGLDKVNYLRADFEQSGKYMVDGFANGITSTINKATEAASNMGWLSLLALNKSVEINSPAWLTTVSGMFFGEGYALGIDNKIKDVTEKAFGMGENSIAALHNGINQGGGSGRAATDFVGFINDKFKGLTKAGKGLGNDLMDEMSKGIDSGSKKTKASAGKAAKTIYDITKEWIDEEKYYKRLSLDEELAKWEEVIAKHRLNGEELKKINREVYRIQNEIIEDAFDKEKKEIEDARYFKKKTLNDELADWIILQEKYAALDERYAKQREEANKKVFQLQEEVANDTYSKEKEWIDDKKYYNQLSLSEELAYWKGIQGQFLAGSEQRKNAAKEVYRVEKELAQEAFNNAKSWISERKYYNDLSLSEELYAWKRIRDEYEEGAAERIEAEREVYRVEQEINSARETLAKDKLDLEEETAQARIDLEEEYYEKVKSVNDQLKQDIETLNKEYEDAVKSRADTIAKSYNLFDYAKMNNGVDGQVLLNNLESQLVAMEDWQSNINGLADRGIADGLLDELRGMGPGSAAEIKALNLLTDEQLTQYVTLWQQKQAMAKDQAVLELEKTKLETEKKIQELNDTANKQLTEYKTTWDTQLADLNAKAAARLVELQKAFDEKIGKLSSETRKKVRELTRDIEDAIEVSSENIVDDVIDLTQNIQTAMETPDWVSIGTNIIAGIQKGLTDKASELAATAARVAREALEAAERELDINSPSGKFMDVGMYSDMGFANGLLRYAHLVKDGASEVGKTALDSIQTAVMKVADLIDSGMDTTPTIRPVLDLSNIEAGARRLGGLFSQDQAVAVATHFNRNNATQNQNAVQPTIQSSEPGVQFVQNNYSPKALSPIEVYRQTKNLIGSVNNR